MQLNNTMLREIVFQISHGNPLWGMLIGNEYLREDNHLRRAIINRFVARMVNMQEQPTTCKMRLLTKKLISGVTAIQLSDELMCLVGARIVRSNRNPPSHSKISAYTRIHGVLSTGFRRTKPQRLRQLRRQLAAHR